ncbi:ATP-binding protein [Chloroflexi bacterium TSY]|nr:ATP-binding protein [Chloroflexi bacterium TSY]
MDIEIPASESQYTEFKSESTRAADLADEIVAFANSDGGEIWLSVEDDGTVSGLSRSYEKDVMNICRTSCIPPIQPAYDEFQVAGTRIARLTIMSGKDKPYYTNRNRYYIRVGTTKRVASREELVRLFQASIFVYYKSHSY